MISENTKKVFESQFNVANNEQKMLLNTAETIFSDYLKEEIEETLYEGELRKSLKKPLMFALAIVLLKKSGAKIY